MAATPARSELRQPGAGAATKDKSGAALACSLPPIVITLRGGQAPGQGRLIEDTMSHDKTRAAARKRAGETGEPYAAARRAVVTAHQSAGAQFRPPGAGYRLRMSAEIHDWLVELRRGDQPAAARVAQVLAALMTEGAGLGDPLVVSTAASWPDALAEALDRSYAEQLEKLAMLRRAAADADKLFIDIHDHLAELDSAQLAASQRQVAELRRLLPGVIKARHQLAEASGRLAARNDALRARKEVLKASYGAASATLRVHEIIASSRPPGEVAAAQATLADVISRMERELGYQAWPEGLMELRPGAMGYTGIRILFAVEPPGSALLIAVLDGSEAVQDHYQEAIVVSADVLRRVRAGEAPEAAAHTYDDPRAILDEFYPSNIGHTGGS